MKTPLVLIAVLLSLFAGHAVAEVSPEEKEIIRKAGRLAPLSDSSCGTSQTLLGGEFACGIFNVSAATTEKFLEAGWRLEKIIIYHPQTMDISSPMPETLKGLRDAYSTTALEIHKCVGKIVCDRVGWMGIFVPPNPKK